MEFTIKDLVYISVYVATVAVVFTKFKGRLDNLANSIDSIKNILFLDKGGLNIVDNAKCEEHQNAVFREIHRESEVTKAAINEIRYLNKNVTKLMIHMKVEPVEQSSE